MSPYFHLKKDLIHGTVFVFLRFGVLRLAKQSLLDVSNVNGHMYFHHDFHQHILFKKELHSQTL